MPGTKDAQYWREYRANKKPGTRNQEMAELRDKITVSPEARVNPKRTEIDMKTGEVAQEPRQYECGCQPGFLCIGHGIAKMSQVAKDKVLSSPEINRPGRRGGKE